MKKFVFKYNGAVLEVEGNTKSEAMGMANRQLPLGDGAWFDDSAINGKDAFRWVEGNFYD
jgi:hypothetical protein